MKSTVSNTEHILVCVELNKKIEAEDCALGVLNSYSK